MSTSAILSFIFGIMATFIGFLLNQTWQQTKERKQKLEKIIALFESTSAELEFYAEKLKQLSAHLAKVGQSQPPIPGMSGIVVPSYDLYPAFLEKAKLELTTFPQTLPIVSRVGSCHYELCHIQEKLAWFKQLAANQQGPQWLMNVVLTAGGLRGLANQNIASFEATANELKECADKYRKELDSFLEFTLFGPWMRD